jgi:hypothetical protein
VEKDKDGYVSATLMHVGISNRSGEIYPEGVIEKAIEKLRSRKAPLCGEIGNPVRREGELHDDYVRRVMSIDQGNVSHIVDTTTLKIENGALIAMVRPTGPQAKLVEEMINNGTMSFALRGLVSYADGNTTNPDYRRSPVTLLDIITFDLTDKPL